MTPAEIARALGTRMPADLDALAKRLSEMEETIREHEARIMSLDAWRDRMVEACLCTFKSDLPALLRLACAPPIDPPTERITRLGGERPGHETEDPR